MRHFFRRILNCVTLYWRYVFIDIFLFLFGYFVSTILVALCFTLARIEEQRSQRRFTVSFGHIRVLKTIFADDDYTSVHNSTDNSSQEQTETMKPSLSVCVAVVDV